MICEDKNSIFMGRISFRWATSAFMVVSSLSRDSILPPGDVLEKGVRLVVLLHNIRVFVKGRGCRGCYKIMREERNTDRNILSNTLMENISLMCVGNDIGKKRCK